MAALEQVGQVSVGQELGDPAGYLIRRTKRLADLLVHANVLTAVQDLVDALDTWCQHNEVPPKQVAAEAIFVRGLNYIDFDFADE